MAVGSDVRMPQLIPEFLTTLNEEFIMWNIVIGIVFVIGGLSGQLALRGTESGPALAVLGVGLIVWGGIQIARRSG